MLVFLILSLKIPYLIHFTNKNIHYRYQIFHTHGVIRIITQPVTINEGKVIANRLIIDIDFLRCFRNCDLSILSLVLYQLNQLFTVSVLVYRALTIELLPHVSGEHLRTRFLSLLNYEF